MEVSCWVLRSEERWLCFLLLLCSGVGSGYLSVAHKILRSVYKAIYFSFYIEIILE